MAITSIVVGLFAIGLVLSLAMLGGDERVAQEKVAVPVASPPPPVRPIDGRRVRELDDRPARLTEDDGKSLWVAPTNGKPISLAYLPLGCQFFLNLRAQEFLAHTEGERVLTALGPAGERLMAVFESISRRPLGAFDQVLAGWRVDETRAWELALVLRLVTAEAREDLWAGLESDAERSTPVGTIRRVGSHVWLKPVGDNVTLVVSSSEAMSEILELEGESPPLRRDLQALHATTDQLRHLTLITSPQFLFVEGREMFAGQFERLKEPLRSFLGEGLRVIGLSAHWDEAFFCELGVVGDIDKSPEIRARELSRQLLESADALEDFVFFRLEPTSYGRRLLSRFPSMVRQLAAYTRTGYTKKVGRLRAYLPSSAGHNLLSAAELALVEPVKAASLTEVTSDRAKESATADPLAKAISLEFPRDTLQTAIELIADELEIAVTIEGQDLQAEGITKNQSFGIALRDKPARDVLVEVLRLANPDKEATGPADPRQKLVYVVRPVRGTGMEIVVTTRSASLRRGEKLPPVWQIRPSTDR